MARVTLVVVAALAVIMITTWATALFLAGRPGLPPTQTSTATKSLPWTTGTNPKQPLAEVTATTLPASIPTTSGPNMTVSCQAPAPTTNHGTISIANQGNGDAALKLLVVQYQGLPAGYTVVSVQGTSCGTLPAYSSTMIFVTGLPAAGKPGSYYDGWFVLTSGAETNVFSAQFT